MGQHEPDRLVVAALRRIDPGLSVEWVTPPGRWGVFYDLPKEGIERMADIVAEELQLHGARLGYLFDKAECQLAAFQAAKGQRLVCYVTEDDGSYRPLDGRVVLKIARMDWNRRNLGIRDWRELLRAKQDELRDRQARTQGDIWDAIRRDKVLARVLSDVLWGLRPTRSVHVVRPTSIRKGERRATA